MISDPYHRQCICLTLSVPLYMVTFAALTRRFPASLGAEPDFAAFGLGEITPRSTMACSRAFEQRREGMAIIKVICSSIGTGDRKEKK